MVLTFTWSTNAPKILWDFPQGKRIATWGILDWIPSYQDNVETQKKLDKQKHKVDTVQNDFYQPES